MLAILEYESTLQAFKISFARTCVVMDVKGEFLESFKVETGYGNEFEVIIEYSWNAEKVCTKCN